VSAAYTRSYRWERLSDDALLDLRFRDLGLAMQGSSIDTEILALGDRLERRGIRFRPHAWFSTEWFSPDGVPGIAVPFYLGHPRLLRLEQRLMGEAEGSRARWRQRLLRHELGHALDTAFALRRRSDWRRVFGKASARYARDYTVRPQSKHYVLHLEHWYAQSHPTEDFAETFAVWLKPRARWRAEYAGWPALAKLEFVDRLMTELIGRKPAQRDRSRIAPIASNGRTLREHYRRRAAWAAGADEGYDRPLVQLFAPRRSSGELSAERFLGDIKPLLLRALLRRTGAHPYAAFQMLRAVRRRARQLDLVARGPRRALLEGALTLHERVFTDFLRRNEETYFL
jgi:hypothetical protein